MPGASRRRSFVDAMVADPPGQTPRALLTATVAAIGIAWAALLGADPAQAQQAPAAAGPNILVIFGDDVGQSNISAYTHGLVGYKTPNIDRIAKEGMMFTDYYAENSCTAGRSTFITGQACLRTGLSKVGIPGAPVGLQKGDITIAQALKPLGYATGQFGKNHLGDRDEYLPTSHGFDEFFGNLYHLNAEEEPERPYWPKDDPAFRQGDVAARRAQVLRRRQDRGHRSADPQAHGNRSTTRPRAPRSISSRGRRAPTAVLHLDELHPHARLHACAAESMRGQERHARQRIRRRHDRDGQNVGKLLKTLDDLEIANNTIVVFTTDNGPNAFTWPDAATTPFRSEKDTNWEGAFRVPAMIRWPGQIKAGEISNEIVSGLDWFPTLLAAAGDPT